MGNKRICSCTASRGDLAAIYAGKAKRVEHILEEFSNVWADKAEARETLAWLGLGKTLGVTSSLGVDGPGLLHTTRSRGIGLDRSI